MNIHAITIGTDFVHGCGERVFYRFDESAVGVLYSAERYGTHSCPVQDTQPLDWHECRHCPAAIFEIEGVQYDDSYGRQQHRCNRRRKQTGPATTAEMPPAPVGSTTTKRPQLWERDIE